MRKKRIGKKLFEKNRTDRVSERTWLLKRQKTGSRKGHMSDDQIFVFFA
jgi:hypothetical protein